jgi:hypothetical protein
VVQWVSGSASCKVSFGVSPSSLPLLGTPLATLTYGAQDMCGFPASSVAFTDPGWLHQWKLSGLLPGRRYHYQVTCEGAKVWGSCLGRGGWNGLYLHLHLHLCGWHERMRDVTVIMKCDHTAKSLGLVGSVLKDATTG